MNKNCSRVIDLANILYAGVFRTSSDLRESDTDRPCANKNFKKVGTLIHPEKGLQSDFIGASITRLVVNEVLSLLASCSCGGFTTSQEEGNLF